MGQAFIIGNQRGNLYVYSFDGELIQKLDTVALEVSSLKVDSKHKLFLACSGDNLFIQQQQQVRTSNSVAGHTLRSFKHQVRISIVELSVYHSLVFTASDNVVFVWDYEFAKMVRQLKFSEDITAIQCINYYSLLLLSTNTGKLLLL